MRCTSNLSRQTRALSCCEYFHGFSSFRISSTPPAAGPGRARSAAMFCPRCGELLPVMRPSSSQNAPTQHSADEHGSAPAPLRRDSAMPASTFCQRRGHANILTRAQECQDSAGSRAPRARGPGATALRKRRRRAAALSLALALAFSRALALSLSLSSLSLPLSLPLALAPALAPSQPPSSESEARPPPQPPARHPTRSAHARPSPSRLGKARRRRTNARARTHTHTEARARRHAAQAPSGPGRRPAAWP